MLLTAKRLILIYFLVKPFYLFDSGSLQPADLLLLLGSILTLTCATMTSENRKKFNKALHSNKLFVMFTLIVTAINTLYFIVYPEVKFILSTLYFAFNLLVIIVFTFLAHDSNFLTKISKVLKISILIQLLAYITGIGRYYSTDRYMGTFNDPNQFGFFLLLSLFMIYIIDSHFKTNKTNIIQQLGIWITGIFLILLSASTGMVLALSIFGVLLSFYLIIKYSKTRNFYRMIASTGLLFLVLFTQAELFNVDYIKKPITDRDLILTQRIESKIDKTNKEVGVSIWEDRGYDTIYKYPQYIVHGAGEGAFWRFKEVTQNYGLEIHATLPGIAFYYGIMPLFILCLWLYNIWRKATISSRIILVSLLVESFTLVNYRQAMLWMLLCIVGFINMSRKTKRKDRINEK